MLALPISYFEIMPYELFITNTYSEYFTGGYSGNTLVYGYLNSQTTLY